jgi:excisionase family DNA binding protein
MTASTEFLGPEDLADLLGVPVQTVYRWNYVGSGPPVIRVGRFVRYRRSAVDSWLESRTEPPAAA